MGPRVNGGGGGRTFEEGELVDAGWSSVAWGGLHVDVAFFALVVADVDDVGEARVVAVDGDELGVDSLDFEQKQKC